MSSERNVYSLVLTAIMEAALMVIRTDKYWVFIYIIRQTQLHISCILVFFFDSNISADANLKFFKSRLVTKQSKLKLYRTVIRPIVTYASETWVLKETIIQKLLVFGRKILRRIFGPTKENQKWRVKTNGELDKMIKHKNIINYIKTQRLSWFGHVQRMQDTRTVKKIFNLKTLTKRLQGRP